MHVSKINEATFAALQGVSTIKKVAICGARDSRAIIFRQAREKGISGF